MKIDSIRPSGVMKLAKDAYDKDVAFYTENKARFTSRSCPGCSKESSDFYLTQGHFTYTRCQACWTVYMNPGPTKSLIKEFYLQSNVYRYWSKHVYPKTQESRKKKLAEPRAELLAQALMSQSGQLKIAEIGAGTGDVLIELLHKFPLAQLIAIEPNPDMWSSYDNKPIRLEKNGYETSLEELRNLDLVCAFEVIEHILEPFEFFQKCSLSLKRGGKLVGSTPNAASIELQSLMYKSNTVDIEHISILTPSALHKLANESGFVIEFIRTPGEFDLELLSREFAYLKVANLILPKWMSKLQGKIANFGFSSHMKFVMTKV